VSRRRGSPALQAVQPNDRRIMSLILAGRWPARSESIGRGPGSSILKTFQRFATFRSPSRGQCGHITRPSSYIRCAQALMLDVLNC
jgi:hypothetical protein